MADLDGLELIFDLIEVVVDAIAYSNRKSSNTSWNKSRQKDYDTKTIFRDDDGTFVRRNNQIFKDGGSITSGTYQKGGISNLTGHLNNKKPVKKTSSYQEEPITTPEDKLEPITTPEKELKPMNQDVLKERHTYQSNSSTIGFNIHRIKLEILLLGYLYLEDDGKVSGKEKREIKKHFNKYKNKLKKEDINEIKGLAGMDSSLMNIRALISQNNVSDGDITRAISVVREINRGEDKYKDIIKRLERTLLDSMGY